MSFPQFVRLRFLPSFSMSSDVVIRVENLGKKYRIRHERPERYTALRDVLANSLRAPWRSLAAAFRKFARPITGGVGYPAAPGSELYGPNSAVAGASLSGCTPCAVSTRRPTQEDLWALEGVSFEVKRGEALGIIGRNGAGKSTLLKILSRITEPSTGEIEIEGRVASLLEVATGFHPELTGRENIFLNGAILGMTRAEIRKRFDEIVAFAEVERFLDTPVKRYSSGMYVRLAFAVAAHLEPEILIVDEVLAVGDTAFQEKCTGKMQEVTHSKGRTVLFVSHSMGTIQSLCARGMVLDAGKIVFDGKSRDAVGHYFRTTKPTGSSECMDDRERIGDGTARIRSLWFEDDRSNRETHFRMGEQITIVFRVDFPTRVLNPTFGVNIIADTGVLVSECRSSHYRPDMKSVEGKVECRINIESIPLLPRVYIIEPWVTDSAGLATFDWVRNAATIVVTSGGSFKGNFDASQGITFIPTSWDIGKAQVELAVLS
jgi:lipopolysaccharide transport system ATP-binding protein